MDIPWFDDFETHAIRGQLPAGPFGEHAVPLYLTSSFVFENAAALKAAFDEESDAYIYSRYSNPNTAELVGKVCQMENAEDGIATASGMAAIYDTFASLLQSGDHIIACSAIFGATHSLLTRYFPRIGIHCDFFDAESPESIESLIRPTTKMIFLETPTNPAISLIDLALVGEIARRFGLVFAVDNCFATPWLQQPLRLGAHIAIHSATKYMDGQGRVLGGLVVGDAALIREIYLFNRITGASMSPFNAWVLSKSLETLSLRMDRHCSNALFIAKSLQSHPSLERISYPFLPGHPQYDIAIKQMKAGGGIIALYVKGGYEAGQRFLDALKMIRISPNLGDSRSIATHPASSTHSKLSEAERLRVGITPGLIRISVGLESADDILQDIEQALQQAKC